MEQDCSITHLNKMSIRLDLSADRGRRRGFFLFVRPCGRSGCGEWQAWMLWVLGLSNLNRSSMSDMEPSTYTHIYSHLTTTSPPISVSTSSIAAQRSLTCLRPQPTQLSVKNPGPASVHPLFIERRNAVWSVALCGGRMFAESPTATGPDACWENVGVGIIDRHVFGSIDGLKERQRRRSPGE